MLVFLDLAPPTNLHVGSSTNSSIHIRWTAPEIGGDAHRVAQYFVLYSSDYGNNGSISNNRALQKQISSLISNTKYIFNVIALTSGSSRSSNQSNSAIGFTSKKFCSPVYRYCKFSEFRYYQAGLF